MLDPGLRKRITDVIIPGYLSDCVKARVLGPDGVYTRAVCPPGQEPQQAQLHFRNLARQSASRRIEQKTEGPEERTYQPVKKPAHNHTTKLPYVG